MRAPRCSGSGRGIQASGCRIGLVLEFEDENEDEDEDENDDEDEAEWVAISLLAQRRLPIRPAGMPTS